MDFGGMFLPNLVGKCVLMFVHDESCFDTGEQQTHGWIPKGVLKCAWTKAEGPINVLINRIGI